MPGESPRAPLHLVPAEPEEGWTREGELWAWHGGETEARARLAEAKAAGGRLIEHYDALREEIRERREIESEVNALVSAHDDVDSLASNLPAIPVPPESAPVRVRLWWLVRRWWYGIRERLSRPSETRPLTKALAAGEDLLTAQDALHQSRQSSKAILPKPGTFKPRKIQTD